MSQEVAQRTPAEELVSRVRTPQFREQVALALPDNVSPERFTRVAVTALLQNPDIATCEPDSVFNSLLRAAADGLLPDGREAALVSFNTKQGDSWVKKAQYMPMIYGYRKIAAEHGWELVTRIVYANDEFVHETGMEEKLVHTPARPGVARGEMVAAYAVGRHADGRRAGPEVMDADAINKVRAVSRANDKGPWVDWEDRMWEKTVGKRLFAKLPLGEKDQARVRRLIQIPDDPAESAAMLYGPGATQGFVARELEQGDITASTGGTDPEHQPQATPEATVEDQPGLEPADDGSPKTGAVDAASAAPAPGSDDSEDQPQPPAPEDTVKNAGLLKWPKRQAKGREDLRWAGKTIAATEAKEPTFIDWALSIPADRWEPEFHAALVLVAEARKQRAA